MSSLPIEGTISAKPFHRVDHDDRGHVRGAPHRSGTISAPVNGSIKGEAVAELSTLISSLGSLSAQAQSLPLTPPSLPGLPQGGYQAQPTDYTQMIGDAT